MRENGTHARCKPRRVRLKVGVMLPARFTTSPASLLLGLVTGSSTNSSPIGRLSSLLLHTGNTVGASKYVNSVVILERAKFIDFN